MQYLQYVIYIFLFLEITLNVLFIGTPGAGKSSTINILLGKDVCEFGQTFKTSGITEELQFCKEKIKTAFELGS